MSGLANSRWQPTKKVLPGAAGDVVQVISWTDACGEAAVTRAIPVPPQPNPPATQSFPPPRQGLAATSTSWPQKLAVSPDGSRVLVALNLANSAAIIDVGASDAVRYVTTGSYPFGAAILPDGCTGPIRNEAAGTLSVIDLVNATKLADITVGAPLSHPQGIVVDAVGARAYVAVSASDQVAVVDLVQRKVEQTISVGRAAGLGTMPVAVGLSPNGERLFVAESGADELAVFRVPAVGAPTADAWTEVGRIPTGDQPQAVVTTADGGGAARLLYATAEATGGGANPTGPDPSKGTDPSFRAFNAKAPTTDVFAGIGYNAPLVNRLAGMLTLPTDAEVAALTPQADKQLQPAGRRRRTRRHSATGQRTHQARVLHRPGKPLLRPASRRCQCRQRRP